MLCFGQDSNCMSTSEEGLLFNQRVVETKAVVTSHENTQGADSGCQKAGAYDVRKL